MQINCSKFIIDDAKIVVQKNINKVNILQIEKKQKRIHAPIKLHCCTGAQG